MPRPRRRMRSRRAQTQGGCGAPSFPTFVGESVAQPKQAPPEVCLDRAKRAACQRRDLVERTLGEEAKRYHLSVWLLQARHGPADRHMVLGGDHGLLGLESESGRDV